MLHPMLLANAALRRSAAPHLSSCGDTELSIHYPPVCKGDRFFQGALPIPDVDFVVVEDPLLLVLRAISALVGALEIAIYN